MTIQNYDIYVEKTNEATLKVFSNDFGIEAELSEHFSFYAPGYKFAPTYRAKVWDGKVALYNQYKKTLPYGLFGYLSAYAKNNNYTVNIQEGILPCSQISLDEIKTFVDSLNIHSKGRKIEMRDYQLDAISKAINNEKILALSKFAKKQYQKTLKYVEITEIPMGVSENFFNISRSATSKKFVVGYLGKGTSSGHDNRIDQIITASKLLEDINDIEYSFVGLELDYEIRMRALIEALQLDVNKFSFINHLSHNEIPKELVNFSVGVIPYPQSSYNDERFPLKAIEYAAAGLPIVATSTNSFRRLLSEEFTIYFEENSPHSFADAVLKLYESAEIYGAKSSNARTYAEKFTYENRAKKIIDLLDSYN
jgi:glycosyltransferase involved in cell wall biosynthesis